MSATDIQKTARSDAAMNAFLAVSDRPPTGRILLAGTLVLGLGLGGFAGWAAYAPLASAAVAPGIVAVDSNRKIVQHVEGGAIAELLVREGDRVRAGQILLRLDNLEAKALHDLLKKQYVALAAHEARLEAEREGLLELVFPTALEAERHRGEVAETLSGQERIFQSGRIALKGQVDVLHQRIAQLNAQIAALDAQLASGKEQLAIIQEEMVGVRELVNKGLERKPRLLGLERNAAYLRGLQGDYANRIAQAKESIAEAELEILNAERTRVEKAALELGQVQAQRVEVEERLAAARAKLGRRDVVAPQAGTVLNLRFHTIGGVVPPGGEILDLVPEDDRLVIEARVSPTDIDAVHPGLKAKVALSTFKSRTMPQLDGTVLQVSADALADERTGQSYFVARIEVDADQLAELEDVRLAPGMPAETFIEIGERTVFEYLVQPLTDSFRRAFREN